MKKILFLSLISSLFLLTLSAQNIGIGTTSPNPSAKLDVTASNQGFLPPRLTFSERNRIVNPASGLIIWCKTCGLTGELQVYNGSSWMVMMAGNASDSFMIPTVTTDPVTSIGTQSATCGGNVLSEGNTPVLEKGVVWSTSPSPTVDLSTKTIDGYGAGSFSSNVSNLNESTTYYIRAYATNIIGTAYGEEISFTTTALNLVSIASLRALYTGSGYRFNDVKTIYGIVTSDLLNNNITAGQFILQDESGAAIVVYIAGIIPKNFGDRLIISIKAGDSLIVYRGSLELKINTTIPFIAPSVVETGQTVTPILKTIAELNASLNAPLGSPENFEMSIVKVIATASPTAGTGTYSGLNLLTDATGSIVLYTQPTASFANIALPVGEYSWTGYVKNYLSTTKEFLMRNLNDVQ